ncbi:MAG: Zn-dependent alcohol dehydrogenase [Actinomycetota bacterium]
MRIEGAVLRELRTPLRIETLDLAAPREGEVLVEMRASGVCHSDWHVVTGDSVVELPVVLGHEGSGVIAELGPAVTGLEVGDHVALSWIPCCRACRPCRAGRPHLCQVHLPALWSGRMLDGTRRLSDTSGAEVFHLSALSTWATHTVVPAISCVPMPDVPFEISAVIGCGVTTGVGAALNRAQIEEGSSVAIFGAGGVGLSILMGAVLAGASQIIVVDRNADKEVLARGLGATDFVAVEPRTDPVAALRHLTDGVGVEYAFDAVGDTEIETQLIAALAQYGTAVLVGFPRAGDTFSLDPADVIRDEKTVTGSIFGSADTHRDFVAYAELYQQGLLPLDRLITERYGLAEINQACDALLTGRTGRGVIVY